MSKLFDLINSIIDRVNSSVKTTPQTLTEAEKTQVKDNLGLSNVITPDCEDHYTKTESDSRYATIPSTATPGQVMTVKEVDANGKPTQWEAVDMASGGGVSSWNDLTDKPFYEEYTELLPPTIFILGDGEEFAPSGACVALDVGDTYVVVYNGVEYACIAADYEEGVIIGNSVAIGGDDTGEPFFMMFLSAEAAEQEGCGIGIAPFDGATEMVVSIKKGSRQQIDTKFLPGYPSEKEEVILIEEQDVQFMDGIGVVEFASIPVPGETYELSFSYLETTQYFSMRAGLYNQDGVNVGVALAGRMSSATAMILYVYPEYVDLVGAASIAQIGTISGSPKISVKRLRDIKQWDQKFVPRPDLPLYDLVEIGFSPLTTTTQQCQASYKYTDQLVEAAKKGPVILRIPEYDSASYNRVVSATRISDRVAVFEWINIIDAGGTGVATKFVVEVQVSTIIGYAIKYEYHSPLSTSDINRLIDAKLAEIPNASGVNF